MRRVSILAIACVFLFFSAGPTIADELSDLKAEVEKLRQKIEELEQKQEEQAESVSALEEEPTAGEVVERELSKRVTVGGHFKFFLGDQSTGDVTNFQVTDESQRNSFAFGVNDLWLYFSKTLTDWLSITVAPKIEVVAQATPVLGGNITRATSASVDVDLDEAYMTVRLPYQFEMRAGAFYPYFSEEYASKVWWHQQYHGNQGLLNLEAWQSTGFEFYRNFDFESFSLPVYLYLVNGEDRSQAQDSRFTDNNNSKNVLLHIAPEFFAWGARFRILGSAGYGRWDDDGDNDSYQFAGGLDFTYGGLNLSGEYMYRGRDNLPLLGPGTEDGEDKGWYVKAIYSFNPQWRLFLKYSDVDLWFPGTDTLLTDNYKVVSAAIDYWIAETSTIIGQVSYVDADRSDDSAKLEYWRYTLGWRTTF